MPPVADARFVKRRLMLLMLKLAIFIGSGARERIDFSATLVPLPNPCLAGGLDRGR